MKPSFAYLGKEKYEQTEDARSLEYGAKWKEMASRTRSGRDSSRNFVDLTILPAHGRTRIGRRAQCSFTWMEYLLVLGRHEEKWILEGPLCVCTALNQEQ